MKILSTLIAIGIPLLSIGAGTQLAHAQDSGSYQVAQQGFELFIDSRGRRFIVDLYTGEVIGRANRNARFTKRDKYRAQRAYRRANRRDRVERDLGTLFDRFTGNNRSRREPDIRVDRRREQRREQLQPSAPNREEELASLPTYKEPVTTAKAPLGMAKPKYGSDTLTKLQVFLDQEGFSPGVIDGRWGSNLARAAVSWKEAKGSKVNLGSAKTVESLLAQSGATDLISYTITAKDVAGPYVRSVPVDYAKKAKLEELSYTSVQEMLAERFHMSKAHLLRLNPGKNFRRAGTKIKVVAPGQPVNKKVHYLIAHKSRNQVRAYDRNGAMVAAYPATIGSSATPSPSGTHSVARIAVNPEYTYNPKKNFQQGDNDKILRIPPGPNGPVGSVWIALSKPTYGIHGTPNPSTIGKTNSHGCIRLTNWDALELAKLVRKGVTVEFIE